MRAYKFNLYIEEDNSVCNSDHHTLESMEFITNLIPSSIYPRLLDIGCGNGKEAYILKQLGYDVTAITQGLNNISYSKKNYPNTNITIMDMHDLEFPSNSFNAIYIHHAFEHSIASFIQLLEMYCVLTDNPPGLVWIGLPHSKEPKDKDFNPEINTINHHHTNMLSSNLFKSLFDIAFNIKQDLSGKYTSPVNSIYFDQAYLLEKKPFNQLHHKIQNIINKRLHLFG